MVNVPFPKPKVKSGRLELHGNRYVLSKADHVESMLEKYQSRSFCGKTRDCSAVETVADQVVMGGFFRLPADIAEILTLQVG
jgi:hypothetical protein